jgi:carbon monoxide dehydrogenase subunit G
MVNAPIERIWADVRDFESHARWIEGASETRMEGGNGTTVGALRTVVVHGMVVTERLTALDDDAHRLAYRIVGDLPMPIYDISGSISMASDTAGDSTLVERVLNYETWLPRDEAEQFRQSRVEILQDSLRLLAKLYET